MDNLSLKITVLRHVRQELGKAAVTRRPRPLSIPAIAAEVGVVQDDVQAMIAQLLKTDLAKPMLGQPEHLAIEGYCEITGKGIEFLDAYEAQWHEPDLAVKPVGFRMPS